MLIGFTDAQNDPSFPGNCTSGVRSILCARGPSRPCPNSPSGFSRETVPLPRQIWYTLSQRTEKETDREPWMKNGSKPFAS